MPMLCYCGQINLLVQSEIEILLWILAFCWLSRLLLCLVSHVGFHVLLWETLLARVAVAWRHRGAVLESQSYLMLVLRCDESVVTLLVLRRYGVYKVFDSSEGLSQPVLRRESSGPSGSSLRALESELREQEESPGAQESELHTGALF